MPDIPCGLAAFSAGRAPDNLYYSLGAQWGYYSLGASGKGVALEQCFTTKPSVWKAEGLPYIPCGLAAFSAGRAPENLYYSVGAQWGYYSLGASGKGVALEGLIQDTFLKNFVEKPGQPGEGQIF